MIRSEASQIPIYYYLFDPILNNSLTIIVKIKTTEGWSKDITCNIGVKKGCPHSPTLSGIYINKLEECLEIVGCKGTEFSSNIITLLLYVDDIILLARIHEDLNK